MDKKGFYKILDIPLTASEKEIKNAFRKKVKQYHPDKNKTDEAKEIYLKLNEAYRVLIDKKSRNAYDNITDKKYGVQPCSQCGKYARQPRFVYFDEINTLKGGVYCRSCASKQQFKSSLINWKKLFKSPVKMWQALYNLAHLNQMPIEKNFDLLMKNAKAFQNENRFHLARSLAMQAKPFATQQNQRLEIEAFLKDLPETKNQTEVNVWKINITDKIRVYMPVFLFFIVVFTSIATPILHHKFSNRYVGIVDYKQPEVVPLKFNLNDDTLLYHTIDGTNAYQAPALQSGILMTLPKETTVRITGYLPNKNWIQAMTHQGLLVYLETKFLQKGIGKKRAPYSSKIILKKD